MQGPSAATTSPALRAEPLHRRDGRLDHAGSAPFQPACAAPMTRASGSANRIMPQSAPVTPSARPGDAVTMPSQRGRALGRPGLGDGDRVGGMDLIGHGEPVRRDAERRGHAGAVFGDGLGRVARADAAVERGVDAFRDPADAGEEAMRDSRKRSVAAVRNGTACHAGFAPGWKPGGAGSLRSATAIALNSAPISPLPLPTRRLRARSNSSARSVLARSASALVLRSMPMARRKSPWSTGP